MKILFISHDAKLYGAPRSLLNLIQGLRRYYPHVSVHVLLPGKGPLEEELRKINVPYTIASYPWNLYKPAGKFFSSKILRNMIGRLRTLSCLPGLLKIVKPLQADIIYSNSSAVSAGFFLARLLGKKHVWHIREFGWEDHRQLYSFGNTVQRMFYKLSDLVIVVSNAIKSKKLNKVKGVRQIYNGVYFQEELVWPPRSIETRDRDQGLTFGMVANILKSKGQEEALAAFYEVQKSQPAARLLFAGGGNEAYIAALKENCRKWGITEKVEFTGYIKDTEACYRRIDVLLSCSVSEGMGRSIVEAMAHGIPVIGKNAGGVPEIIKNDEYGFIYDDTADLVRKMNKIIGNPGQYASFSKNVISCVKRYFTIDKYTEQVYDALSSLGIPEGK